MNNNVKKESLILMFTLLFIFISQVIRENLMYELFLNPLLLFTIFTFKSRDLYQKVLGVTAYISYLALNFVHFNYLHLNSSPIFASAVLSSVLISGISYIYEDKEFINKDNNRKITNIKTRALILLTAIFSLIVSIIPYFIIKSLWAGTFLSYGGNTALMFGVLLFLESLGKNIIENNSDDFDKVQEVQPRKPANLNVIKFLTVLLIAIDFSVFGYVIKPNDKGFTVSLLFVIAILIITAFVRVFEDENENIFFFLYNKLRPFQSVVLLILFITHQKSYDFGALYLTAATLAHVLWAIGYINIKTLLVAEVLIFTCPILGYLSNPFNLKYNEPNYFYFDNKDRNERKNDKDLLKSYVNGINNADLDSLFNSKFSNDESYKNEKYEDIKTKEENNVNEINSNEKSYNNKPKDYYQVVNVKEFNFDNNSYILSFAPWNNYSKTVKVGLISFDKNKPGKMVFEGLPIQKDINGKITILDPEDETYMDDFNIEQKNNYMWTKTAFGYLPYKDSTFELRTLNDETAVNQTINYLKEHNNHKYSNGKYYSFFFIPRESSPDNVDQLLVMSLGELIEGENPDFDKTYSLTEASFFNRLSKENYQNANYKKR